MEPSEYQEGVDAFKQFKSRADNPYHPQDKPQEHKDWDRGWVSQSGGFE
jgi:hypothetical protein